MQIKYQNQVRIANVQFYFLMWFGDNIYPLAMVSLFSLPDEAILSASSQTVYLCDALVGCEGLAVVPITNIYSVVAMFPDMKASEDGSTTATGKFALMRHAYMSPCCIKCPMLSIKTTCNLALYIAKANVDPY